MYEILKKYWKHILLALCLLYLSGRGYYFQYKYKQQYSLVAEYRKQLDEARVRSESYARYLESAKETNRELGTVLSRSVDTLAELREQIRAVKYSYAKMENLLSGIYRNNMLSINNTVDTSPILE